MKKLLLILAVTIMAILVTACVDGSTPTEQQSPTLDNDSVLGWLDNDYDKSFTLLQPGDTLIYKMERDKYGEISPIPIHVIYTQ